MSTFANGLLNNVSRKESYFPFTYRSEAYMWQTSGTGGVWMIDDYAGYVVTACKENDVAMTADVSLAALAASDTSATGRWFWDGAVEKFYVKPLNGTTPQENFYVASLQAYYNKDGQALSGTPYEARVVTPPPLNLVTAPTFTGEVAQTAAGSMGMHNTDAALLPWFLEPDCEVEMTAVISTFGGV